MRFYTIYKVAYEVALGSDLSKQQAKWEHIVRLTKKKRWNYKHRPISERELEAILRREEWIHVAKSILPNGELGFLELGCAPGNLSAAFCFDRRWKPSGIDYSDDSSLYIETLERFRKKATLYEFDLFDEQLNQTFDIVSSFGLIEHFRGSTFDRLIAIHNNYVKPGGYLILVVPNFTGFQYFWHYIFDRPDLDNHNIDVMQLPVFQDFIGDQYEILFLDYVGTMRLWGNTGFTGTWLGGKAVAGLAHGLSAAARTLSRLGLPVKGRSFSPYILCIGRKRSEIA